MQMAEKTTLETGNLSCSNAAVRPFIATIIFCS